MKTYAAILSLALAATPVVAQPAQPPQCIPRDQALETLYRSHGERPVAYMLDKSGMVFELLASNDGSTWTLLATRPDMTSCYVTDGEHLVTTPLGDPS